MRPKKPKTQAPLEPPKPALSASTALPNYTYYGLVPCVGSEPAVYDGDSLKIIIDLGCEMWVGPTQYRLWGINAPELEGSTYAAGAAARDYLKQLIRQCPVWYPEQSSQGMTWPGNGWGIIVVTHKENKSGDYRMREQREKYGRWLVELFGQKDGKLVNLNQMMVDAGHASLYFP